MTGGARLVPLAAGHGKLESADLERHFSRAGSLVPHNSRVAALSITQSSELGMVYTPDEVAVLTQIAQTHGVSVHMDGARFANAVAATGCSPAELSWQAGVDVLCLGATKCGALAAEAVIFFNHKLADGFIHRRKRSGHLLSKGRLFGSQFEGWLAENHWLDLATHANNMAGQLAFQLQQLPGVRMAWPTQANEIFAVIPKPLHERLSAAGAVYYEWPATGLAHHDELAKDEVLIRMVTSFETHPEEITRLIQSAGGG
jgi:threonine aldolase